MILLFGMIYSKLKTYLHGRKVTVKNGECTSFWFDSWLYEKPLETLFPDLYELCENKELSVAQVKKGEIVVTFRRWLIDNLRILRSIFVRKY
jgi:hypothetical protein